MAGSVPRVVFIYSIGDFGISGFHGSFTANSYEQISKKAKKKKKKKTLADLLLNAAFR
jgi:hypothetical protein